MHHRISTAPGLAAGLATLLLSAMPLRAEPPRVAADIAPVHSLAAMVMAGVGEPALILPPGASPHGHGMRPSEAAALDAADVIFWIGPDLTPWLAQAVENLGADAQVVTLADLPGLTRLGYREGVRFAAHDHGHDHGHGSHDPARARDHEEDRDREGDDDHDHAGLDPHLWLDPVNAVRIARTMAETLAGADPANAKAYRANAAAATAQIEALAGRIRERLAPLAGRPFLVFHDAYHYFEARFGIEAAGAISLGDAAEPGAARVAEVRHLLAELRVVCVFAEPQFPPRLAERLLEGTRARLGTLDPLGTRHAGPGPGLYLALLEGLAADLDACLTDG